MEPDLLGPLIVAGVVGGSLIVLLGVCGGYYMYRQRRMQVIDGKKYKVKGEDPKPVAARCRRAAAACCPCFPGLRDEEESPATTIAVKRVQRTNTGKENTLKVQVRGMAV